MLFKYSMGEVLLVEKEEIKEVRFFKVNPEKSRWYHKRLQLDQSNIPISDNFKLLPSLTYCIADDWLMISGTPTVHEKGYYKCIIYNINNIILKEFTLKIVD